MMAKGFWAGVMLATAPVIAGAQATQAVNPAYRRAQTMVNDGNAAAGRALVDSMISTAAPGSSDYAEGVYWRAVLAATAADAEMDYRRIVVDYPMSPRVEDALIRLAQLEMARGNYDAALRHLNRLTAEHPESTTRGRAAYWTARALFDKNDIQGGCAATSDALARTAEGDTELRNQITYLNQRCANLAPAVTALPPAAAPTSTPTASAAPVDSTVTLPPAAPKPIQPAAQDTPKAAIERPAPEKPALSPRPSAPTPKESSSATGNVYSVQVAAYNVKSQADVMVAKLKKSGYEARVDGTSAPFRVRIGKYATQAQAGAVQRSLKAKQITGFVVQADIR